MDPGPADTARDKAKEAGRVALGIVLAPLAASALFAQFVFGSVIWTPLVALYAVPIALVIGVPLYLMLRRMVRPRLRNAVLAGGLAAAGPVLAWLVAREVPWHASTFGYVTAIDRQWTLAGWIEMIGLSLFVFCFGAVGGCVFWLVAGPRSARPNPPPPTDGRTPPRPQEP